ncbi:hypothetical protein MBLNU230_g4761t1 [Neophaeotheca triangularis]
MPITTSTERNPLRPYYIPPSIGPAPSTSQSQPSHAHTSGLPSSYSSTARDYLPELDLDIRSTTSEAWTSARSLIDSLAWRYTSVLLAQPFDVAKTVLQVSLPPDAATGSADPKKKKSPRRKTSRKEHTSRSKYETSEDETADSDESDTPDYFTSSAPRSRSPRKRRRTPSPQSPSPPPSTTPTGRRKRSSRSPASNPPSPYLPLKRIDSINHALSILYTHSGAIGLWRGTNCTFLYTLLHRTTDAFLRSLLLTILGLPETASPLDSTSVLSRPASALSPDLSDTPSPLATLALTTLASTLTGLLLAPLDLVRTKLIITPLTHAPRSTLSNLKRLPSLFVPSSLTLPTILHSSLPSLISTALPLFARRQFSLTPETTPNLWPLFSFATSILELFLRLPLETLLRRAQVSSLRAQHRHATSKSRTDADLELPTIIPTAPYLGISGTVYSILYSEGEVAARDGKGMVRVRMGQGVKGLVRGWRVGFWGIVGVWGAGALGSSGNVGGEF